MKKEEQFDKHELGNTPTNVKIVYWMEYWNRTGKLTEN